MTLSLICRDYLSDRRLNDPEFTYSSVILGAENPQCRLPEIQARVSNFQLLINLISGTLSAIVSPKLGVLSDGYGRNKVIALTAVGTVLSEIITIFVAARSDVFSVNWLLLGAVFDGSLGSLTTALALSQSYAADCTAPDRRNVAFGYFHGILFSGIAIGPLIAGYLIKWTGDILIVFYSVLGCQLLFFFCVAFLIPESLSQERQRHNRTKQGINYYGIRTFLSWSNLNPFSLLRPLWILFPTYAKYGLQYSTDRRKFRDLRVNLSVLAAIDTIVFGVAMGTMAILVLYAEYMFGWGNFESSILVSVVGGVRVIVLFVILPLVTHLFRRWRTAKANTGCDMFDITTIRVSILLEVLGYIGYCLARSGTTLLLSVGLTALSAMTSPTLQSSLTKHIPPDKTGQLLGAIGLLHALARVAAPTVFNFVYSLTVGSMPQAVFMCLASLVFLGFLASWAIKPHGMFTLTDSKYSQISY